MGEISKTAADKLHEGGKGKAELFGDEALLPVMPVRPYDRRNGILIDQRLAGEDMPVSGRVFITRCNRDLDRKREL